MSIRLEAMWPLLQVHDMPRALAFYRDALGFAMVEPAPARDDCDWCLLRLGHVELMLNTRHERDERPPHEDMALRAAHADTSLFFACTDLDAARAALLERGIDIAPPVTRDYGMRQLMLGDPDGYQLCLQCPVDPQ